MGIKYKFYLLRGQASSLDFGKIVNEDGEVTSTYNEEFCVSNMITCDTDSDRIIQISAFIKYNLMSIHQYDKDRNYIGEVSISSGTKYYALPADVSYIRVMFYILRRPNDSYDTIYQGYCIEPHYKSLSKKYERQSDTLLFTESLSGTITLVGRPAVAVYSDYSINREFLISILRYDDDKQDGYIYYSGSFFRTDCKYDVYKEQLTISSLTWHNSVNLLLERQEDTVDILKKPIALTTLSIQKRPYIQIYCSGSGTIANISASGAYWEEQVTEPITDADELASMQYKNNTWIGVAKIRNTYLGGTVDVAEDVQGTYLAIMDSRPQSLDSMDIVYTHANGLYTLQTTNRSDIGKVTRISDGAIIYQATDSTRGMYIDSNGRYTKLAVIGRGSLGGYMYEEVWSRLIHNNSSSGARLNKNTDIADVNSNYTRASEFSITASLVINTDITDEPSIYGQTSAGLYYQPVAGTTKYFPIDKSNWGDEYSVWVDSSIIDSISGDPETAQRYDMKDAYSVGAVIRILLEEITPNIEFKESTQSSIFLYGNTSVVSGYDAFRLYLTQITNILKGQYDAAAKKLEITFKELMELLAQIFECYWYVDQNNILHIEHISWYINGGSYDDTGKSVAYDLTTLRDRYNKVPLSYFQGEVSYDKNLLPSRYEFGWSEEATDLFKCNLSISSRYVQRDKVETVAPNASVDIDFMLANPNTYSSDGIAMMITPYDSNSITKGQIAAKDELGRPYTPNIQNDMLSWLKLVNLYMYNIPSTQFSVTGLRSQPLAQKMAKAVKQTVTFIAPTDPNVYDLIKTSIGDGSIESITIDITNQVATAQIEFGI